MAFPSRIECHCDEIDTMESTGEPEARIIKRKVDFDYFESTDFVRHRLCEALESVGEMPASCALCDVDPDSLIEVSAGILKAENAIRKAVEYQMGENTFDWCLTYMAVPQELCKVYRPEKGIVALRFPAVIQGSRGEWYSKKRSVDKGYAISLLDKSIYRLTKDALLRDVSENGEIEMPFETVFLVFIRHLPDCLTPRCIGYADNNNIETGYITNAISEVLRKGDNYMNMGFVYLAVPCEGDPCVDVILCKQEQLIHWIKPFQTGP